MASCTSDLLKQKQEKKENYTQEILSRNSELDFENVEFKILLLQQLVKVLRNAKTRRQKKSQTTKHTKTERTSSQGWYFETSLEHQTSGVGISILYGKYYT